MGCSQAKSLCPWDSPGKKSGVDCHALLQGIFLIQGSNPCLLCLLLWQVDSLSLVPPGKPIYACVHVKSLQLRPALCVTLWTVACRASLSMGFSRQEYWSRLPCPPPGDLPKSGIRPASLLYHAFACTVSFPLAPPGKPISLSYLDLIETS